VDERLPLVVITDSNFELDDIEQDELVNVAHVVRADARHESEVIAAGAGATGLLVQWAPITSAVIEALPELQFVVRYGVGLDNVDIDAAARNGVVVRNVDDYCIEEVAAHAISMVQCRARRLVAYDRQVKEGTWRADLVESPRLSKAEIVGVAGFGRIGRRVAESAESLGYPVLFWDPYVAARDEKARRYGRVESIEDLAAQSVHLSLHLPATNETIALVGTDVLNTLGPQGHLINTARGSLVDETALLAALNHERLGWASLDVFCEEPPAGVSAQLASHPRVTASPHVAYRSTQSPTSLRRKAAAIARDLVGRADLVADAPGKARTCRSQ
jgi:D-3-phosphoglycerate dehydrogenase